MKKAVVTGVSWDTGLGFAITKQLVEDGYFVYAIYHSDESTAKDILERDFADSVKCVQCDLTDRDAIAEFIASMENIELNAIINNAGAFSGNEDIDNYDIFEWDRVFAVNVTAPLLLSTGLKKVLLLVRLLLTW